MNSETGHARFNSLPELLGPPVQPVQPVQQEPREQRVILLVLVAKDVLTWTRECFKAPLESQSVLTWCNPIVVLVSIATQVLTLTFFSLQAKPVPTQHRARLLSLLPPETPEPPELLEPLEVRPLAT